MKKYWKPAIEIAEIRNLSMIAASGFNPTDKQTDDDSEGDVGGNSPFRRRW